MGLLRAVLTLPLAPVTGLVALAEQIQNQAEDQLYDPRQIRSELEAIAARRREQTISEEEAEELEELLLQRLLIARDRATEGMS
jgi:gas vesicle protein GvpG